MKVLILCTGNSCRSQMAEGFLKSFDQNMEVYSAGTQPSKLVHPLAIDVMKEESINLEDHYPESVNTYLGIDFDYVVTVCGGAQESCPTFSGKVKQNLHIGFDDPADAVGSQEFILSEFRRIRDEIKRDFTAFYSKEIKK